MGVMLRKTMSRSPVPVCSGDIQAWPVSQEELVASTCYKTADVIFVVVFGLIEIESWTHICSEAERIHSAIGQMLLSNTKEHICSALLDPCSWLLIMPIR